jgi:hypothetical protein
MTKAAIARALKGTPDPVVLRELAPEEDAEATLRDLRTKAPPGAVLYLRRAGVSRDRTTIPMGLHPYPAAVIGRMRAGPPDPA